MSVMNNKTLKLIITSLTRKFQRMCKDLQNIHSTVYKVICIKYFYSLDKFTILLLLLIMIAY